LAGLPVLLSASIPDSLRGTPRAQDLYSAVVELVRRTLEAGGRLVFGGHPMITPLVHRVAIAAGGNRPAIDLYQLRCFEKDAPQEIWDRQIFREIRWCGAADEEAPTPGDFAEMREAMAEAAQAAVFMGGQTEGFLGDKPGIRDEYERFMQHHTDGPVYLVGLLGGETVNIIRDVKEGCATEPNGLSADQGHHAAAREKYQAVIDTYPDSEWAGNAQMAIAQCWKKEGKQKEALGAYERFIQEYPDSELIPDALLKAADLDFNIGGAEKAEKYYRRLLQDHPEREGGGAVSLRLALCLHVQGRTDEAVEAYEKLANDENVEESYRVEALHYLGEACIQAHRSEAAVQALEKLLTNFPRSHQTPSALYWLGYLHEMEGRSAEVFKAYQRLVTEFPQHPLTQQIRPRFEELRKAFEKD
jgi:TolA-binding protein